MIQKGKQFALFIILILASAIILPNLENSITGYTTGTGAYDCKRPIITENPLEKTSTKSTRGYEEKKASLRINKELTQSLKQAGKIPKDSTIITCTTTTKLKENTKALPVTRLVRVYDHTNPKKNPNNPYRLMKIIDSNGKQKTFSLTGRGIYYYPQLEICQQLICTNEEHILIPQSNMDVDIKCTTDLASTTGHVST